MVYGDSCEASLVEQWMQLLGLKLVGQLCDSGGIIRMYWTGRFIP